MSLNFNQKRARLEKLGVRFLHFFEIDSTNSEAIRRARIGEREGLVIYADFQSRGRGRRGRSWQAPPSSSLLVSVLLEPKIPAEVQGLLPIITGLAGAEAIFHLTGFKPGIIWPNDLWGKQGKLGGVLVEGIYQGERFLAVAGLGINLLQEKKHFPEEFRPRASSLKIETGENIARDELLLEFLEKLFFWKTCLEKGKLQSIVEQYRGYDIIKEKEVRIFFQGNTIKARAKSIDQKGRLRIEKEGKEELISAGEIIMLRSEEDAFGD